MSVRHVVRKRAVIALFIAGLLVTTAFASTAIGSPGGSASPSADPQIAALQKQVKLLQAQVTALKKVNNQQWNNLDAGWASQNCLAAQIADLLQGTWGVIDRVGLAQATPTTYFGPQTQVPDYGACGSLRDPTVPRGAIQVPPKVDPLLPLLQWIHS